LPATSGAFSMSGRNTERPGAGSPKSLRAVIDLGRYAEVFAYDDEKHVFSLDNP